MTNKLFKLDIIGFVFVSILGTLSHFFYEWSGESTAVGLFTPINESVWEHLKLIFFPFLIWSIVQAIIIKRGNILFPKFVGVIAGMSATLSFFYTYTGMIGKNIDWLNILSFFVGVFIAFLVDYVIIKSDKLQNKTATVIAIILFGAMSAIFILFTFAAPLIPLFKDPITSSYGI